MRADGAWEALVADYCYADAAEPLRRIFDIARGHGVAWIVKEPRYIDADWRSQLGRYYLGAFRRYASVCHRLHFFTHRVPDDLNGLNEHQDFYRGYTVLRPLPVAPVGRTMISPPAELDEAVRCESEERIDLFGWLMTIRAMPFISQDTQVLRCAHAALWMVLAHARFNHGLPRRLPAEIHDAGGAGHSLGRQLPSDGLNASQMFTAMESLGLSPTRKVLATSRAEDEEAGDLRLYSLICRYINSSLPPIVISHQHAWAMVAYERLPPGSEHPVRLWRHDDARGPYLPVADPWNEPEAAHTPWLAAFLPLLPKVHLDAERAESVARSWLGPAVSGQRNLRANAVRDNLMDGTALRTFVMRSSDFKQQLAARGVPPQLASAYRLAPMSRYVWIVEVVLRDRRAQSLPDVIGEFIIDATLTQFEPLTSPATLLAIHLDTFAYLSGVDGSEALTVNVAENSVYRTACASLGGGSDGGATRR